MDPTPAKAGAFVETATVMGFRLQTAEAAPRCQLRFHPRRCAELRAACCPQESLHVRTCAGLDATVHRIVAWGERFMSTARLGDSQLALHSPSGVLAPRTIRPPCPGIASVRARLGTVPVVVLFDTRTAPSSRGRRSWVYGGTEALATLVRPCTLRVSTHAHRYICHAARARVPAGRPASPGELARHLGAAVL